MALMDILDAARLVNAGIAGITTAYQTVPERPPEDDDLPSIIQEPVAGDVTWLVSQERIDHRWYIDVLVKRDGDLQAEYEALIGYLTPVIAAYRSQQNLGLSNVYAVEPVSYTVLTLSVLQASYCALRIEMHAREKYAVTLSVA